MGMELLEGILEGLMTRMLWDGGREVMMEVGGIGLEIQAEKRGRKAVHRRFW